YTLAAAFGNTSSASDVSQTNPGTRTDSPSKSPRKSAFTPFEPNRPISDVTASGWLPWGSGNAGTRTSTLKVGAAAHWCALTSNELFETNFSFRPINGPGYDGLLAHLYKEGKGTDGTTFNASHNNMA
ncbi:hypothetical protein IWW57_006355, partial [Coemansia sp. S610]